MKVFDIDWKIGNGESIVERANLHGDVIINEINPYWYPSRGFENRSGIDKNDIFILFHLDR